VRAQRWAALAAATPAVGDVSAASDDLLDLVPELSPTAQSPETRFIMVKGTSLPIPKWSSGNWCRERHMPRPRRTTGRCCS